LLISGVVLDGPRIVLVQWNSHVHLKLAPTIRKLNHKIIPIFVVCEDRGEEVSELVCHAYMIVGSDERASQFLGLPFEFPNPGRLLSLLGRGPATPRASTRASDASPSEDLGHEFLEGRTLLDRLNLEGSVGRFIHRNENTRTLLLDCVDHDTLLIVVFRLHCLKCPRIVHKLLHGKLRFRIDRAIALCYNPAMDTAMKKRYADAARDALLVQNGCNPSGIVFQFCEHMRTICDLSHVLGQDTEWKNKHAISKLFISKLADLSGPLEIEDIQTCKEIVREFGK